MPKSYKFKKVKRKLEYFKNNTIKLPDIFTDVNDIIYYNNSNKLVIKEDYFNLLELSNNNYNFLKL